MGRARDVDAARVVIGVLDHRRFTMFDRPSREADIERRLVAEDRLGIFVAGENGGTDAPLAVDPIDREGVVAQDHLQGVGDHFENARGIERRQQPLVHIEKPPLAGELVLELSLLELQSAGVLGIDDGLRSVSGEDRNRRSVDLIELAPPTLGQDDHAPDGVLVRHRHEQHRFRSVDGSDGHTSRIGSRVGDDERLTVLGDPARQPAPDRQAQ